MGRSALAVLWCLATIWAAPDDELRAQTFEEVSASVGIATAHQLGGICEKPPIGMGSAWADYDSDGDIDLYVTNQNGPNQLYSNQGDLNSDGLPDFVDQAVLLGVAQDQEASLGTVFVDYDNDGDQDLFVGNWGGNSLFQNRLVETGAVSFVDVASEAGLVNDGRVITAAWADFDRDGHLDVYLAKHGDCSENPMGQDALFHNRGDGTFAKVNTWLCGGSETCDQVEGLGFSAGWFDYDHDGDEDLYVVNDNIEKLFYHNVLWRNDGPDGLGGWWFTDVSQVSGMDHDVNAMGLAIGDPDNDGWLDVAFSNVGPNKLLGNRGDGTFVDVSVASGIERATHQNGQSITWATAFFDYDNDQLLDLFLAAGYIDEDDALEHPNAFFRNRGDRSFDDLSASVGLDHPGRARAASMVDLNEDGYVDLFVANYGQAPLLYVNRAEEDQDNGWLSLSAEGTISHRDAIGTVVHVTTPDGVVQQRLVSSGPTHGGGDQRRAFFGLGDQPFAEIKARWPSGIEKTFPLVSKDKHLHLVEPEIELNLVAVGPNEPGVVDRFEVAGGAEAGAKLLLYSALSRNPAPLQGCRGVVGEFENPRLLAQTTLDGSGEGQLDFLVPAAASGRTVFFQAVMPDYCAVSNVVEVVYP